jgi:hypothetical protein
MRVNRVAALIAVCVLATACAGSPADAPPDDGADDVVVVDEDVMGEDSASAEAAIERIVEPEATEVLRSMADALTAAKRFSLEAQITNETFLSNGQGIELATDVRVTLRRPNGVLVDRRTDKYHRRLHFDGSTVVMDDVDQNLYATKELSGTVDDLLDALFERFGVNVPLADLVVRDPYTSLSQYADTVLYVGVSRVRGIPCHHVAFTNDVLDWQVWIQSEGPPLPRKMVLVHKDEPGMPRFSAFITKWDLAPDAPDSVFTFQPPAGAEQIELTESETIEDTEGGE